MARWCRCEEPAEGLSDYADLPRCAECGKWVHKKQRAAFLERRKNWSGPYAIHYNTTTCHYADGSVVQYSGSQTGAR